MNIVRTIRALAALCLSVTTTASAQYISFDNAVAIAHSFVPELRVTHVGYEIDPLTLRMMCVVFGPSNKPDFGWHVEIDALTGAPAAVAGDALTELQRLELIPVLPRLHLCTVTAGQAAQLAATALARPLSHVTSVALTSTNTVLVQTAAFNDLAVLAIDGIAGVRLSDGFEGEPVARATAVQMSAAIQSAEIALGPGWRFLRARAARQAPSLILDIVMLEPVKGMLRTVRVVVGVTNTVTISAAYAPRGTLAADAQFLRKSPPPIGSTPHTALARMNNSAAVIRLYDFRWQANNGAPQWSGSCDTTAAFFNAEFTMFLEAAVPSQSGLIYGRRELAIFAADFDRDGHINGADLAEILATWGVHYPPYDLDESGLVDGGDLAIILNSWR